MGIGYHVVERIDRIAELKQLFTVDPLHIMRGINAEPAPRNYAQTNSTLVVKNSDYLIFGCMDHLGHSGLGIVIRAEVGVGPGSDTLSRSSIIFGVGYAGGISVGPG